ncbi:MAG: hypothetical protein LBH03_04520, partial [Holophagales bacterium]|nr:hypothetical protein [Holophagales bacterium]
MFKHNLHNLLKAPALLMALFCLFTPVAQAQSKKQKQADAAAKAPLPDDQKKVVAVLEPVGAANVTMMNK